MSDDPTAALAPRDSAVRRPAGALRRAAKLLRRDQRGVVALNFGLMILPLLGAVGLAIDFGMVMTARTKAQMAADAASLQASGIARDLIKAGGGTAAETTAAMAEAKKRGEALFAAHAAQGGLGAYKINLSVARNGQVIETTADFSVETRTFIGKVLGRDSFTAVGDAVATSSLPTYIDVYVLMDVSQSMGLAATSADMTKLYNATKALTPEGCTFGCHIPKTNYPTGTLSNETIAKLNDVTLRVDVLRKSVTDMITDAQTNAGGDSVYRFGLYTMSLNVAKTSYALNEISAISGNYTTLKTAATNIALSGNNNGNGIGDSHVNEQIRDLDAKIPNSGDGSSQDKAKVFLFVITDGVRDVRGSSDTNHIVSVIDPSYCAPYKTTSANVTVSVLYTTYLPIYNENNPAKGLNGDYAGLVAPLASKIAPALQNCASKDWFFEAADEVGIHAAFDKMFSQTSAAPSLTN